MVLTVKAYLNARTPAGTELPSVSLPNPYYKSPGEVLEIVDSRIGQEYHGSAVWYLAADGQYYWSGGFVQTEFALANVDFANLPQDGKRTLIDECVRYFYPFFEKNTVGFTGLTSASKNKAATQPCIAVHVAKKKDGTQFKIPAGLEYKGFKIPTDVVEEGQPEPIAIGDSISSEKNNKGTAGFFFTANGQRYMVTNYHVVCRSRILQRKFSYDAAVKNEKITVSMPAFGRTIAGEVQFGMLDNYKDFAVIKVDQPHPNTATGYSFNGVYPQEQLYNDFKPNTHLVQMLGASSGFGSRHIQSLNARIPLKYFKTIPLELLRLIQIDKMTKPGDSGSSLIEQNLLVGLIVAESTSFSYAIPIGNVLPEIKKKLGNITF